jgi:hypothetical protein
MLLEDSTPGIVAAELPSRTGGCPPGPPGRRRGYPAPSPTDRSMRISHITLFRRGKAHVTGYPGPVSGSCFALPRSPWPTPFLPPSPPVPGSNLCSRASSVLYSGLTPCTRASRSCLPGSPCGPGITARPDVGSPRVPYTVFPCMREVSDPARFTHPLP